MATFQVPSLAGLGGGRNLRGTFERMVGSLQAQIAINAPRDDDPAHLTQVVNELVDQYEGAAGSLFGSKPALRTLLVYQGETTRDAINALNLQLNVGLINRPAFNSNAFMEINELTQSRQVWPVGTPLQTYLVLSTKTSDDIANLSVVVQTSTVTNETAAAVVRAEAEAFQSEVLLATTRQPRIGNTVVNVSANLTSQVDAAVGSPDFAAQLVAASTTFASALVEPGGFFGPGGAIGRRYAQLPNVPSPLGISDASTFANLQYRQIETTSPLVLHRNFSSSSNRFGRFLSADTFKSPTDAVRRLALDQSWYGTNQAYFVEDVTVPANSKVYVGRVAPIFQGIFQREAKPSLYPGMASQYLILNTRDPGIVWDNFRATGT
ncbi:MAG: hypothetical protein P4L85_03260 [Paludisphaera borealis]|uniref:hypothetical protein n=1 Tax=Paludisphaera borealis TaxID=1387353 RepID=UPI002851AF82|nr:hypothetical protein [Paludisphaera borealis]MDR3618343.1 hypothetical protein [Paludisphaera borealis]